MKRLDNRLVRYFPLWLLVMAAACATAPANPRPTTIEAFLGEWTGTWRDRAGQAAGELLVNIKPGTGPSGVKLFANQGNAPGGLQTVEASGELRDAALQLVTTRGSSLTLESVGDARIEGYYSHPSRSSGTWSLTRKRN